MNVPRPAIRSVALAGALGACFSACSFAALLSPGQARGAPLEPIRGKLDRRGLVVVALAPNGRLAESVHGRASASSRRPASCGWSFAIAGAPTSAPWSSAAAADG